MRAARPALHEALPRDDHPDRQARAEALGERRDVGRHAPMLAGEHAAGAADTRLDLVRDHQDAVAVAQRAQPRQEARRRDDVAALALDRLDEHRRHLARRHGAREQDVLDVVEHRAPLVLAREKRAIGVGVRHERDARHRREKALLLRVLARGERERAHRAPVEAAEEPDEARPPRDVARELERGLDTLRPRLAEEAHRRLVHGRKRRQPLAEAHLALVPVVRAHVQEALGGVLDRGHHVRVRVAGRGHGDAGGEVQEAVAVDVPGFDPLAVRDHERVLARVGRRHDAKVALDDRARLRPRQLAADVRGLHGSPSFKSAPRTRVNGPSAPGHDTVAARASASPAQECIIQPA